MNSAPICNGLSIIARDLARSVAFYRLCGLELPDPGAEGHVEVAVAGGFRIMIDSEATIGSFEPDWTPPTGGHRVALAVEVDSADEVDARYAEITGAGFASHLAPFDAVWGQRYASVYDPDSTPVDLYAWVSAPAGS